jgi:tetratricopeptide (TPR) repeat protein
LLFGAMNRPAEAAQCLVQALQIDPGNPLGWANLASMNGQLDRHAQALECAERALALDPHMVEAQLHRARAAQSLGKPEIVRAASEALAKLPPEKFRRMR